MTFEDAVQEVASTLATNRQGAYPIAVRLGAVHGFNVDKLMAAAVAAPSGSAPIRAGSASGPGLVQLGDVQFPTAEEIEAELLKAIQEHFAKPIGQSTYTLAHCFVQQMVEDRNRILQMLGALEYPQ